MGIDRISIKVDGIEDQAIDFNASVTNLLPGNHVIAVEAYDGISLIHSQSRNVFVAAIEPIIINPTNGQVISEGSDITMEIADYPNANSVSYYSGTTLLGTSTTAPNFPVSYPNAALGTYNIHAVATVNGVISPNSEIVTISVEEVADWAITAVDAYEARVLADYGIVEDKAALITYLES